MHDSSRSICTPFCNIKQSHMKKSVGDIVSIVYNARLVLPARVTAQLVPRHHLNSIIGNDVTPLRIRIQDPKEYDKNRNK